MKLVLKPSDPDISGDISVAYYSGVLPERGGGRFPPKLCLVTFGLMNYASIDSGCERYLNEELTSDSVYGFILSGETTDGMSPSCRLPVHM